MGWDLRATEWDTGVFDGLCRHEVPSPDLSRTLSPAVHPLTAVDLQQIGRLMFFDPTLSASGKLACATLS